jgi:uncharacterized glyoxalase superfamily protein PhnB
MPAYDRPIQIRVDAEVQRRTHDSVGAVLKFNSNDIDRIQAWLDRAAEAGIIQPTVAKSYQSAYGEPVWYIP